jgi:hypothetical protein
VLPALLVACTPDAPPAAVPEPDDIEVPSLTTTEPVATWTPDDAVAAIEEALGGEFPSPFVVRGALQSVFQHGDEECPGLGTYMAGPSFEGCTSAQGWYYLGVGGYSETVEEDEFGSYVELNIAGDLTIIDPAGPELDVGGHWIVDLHEGPSWRGFANGDYLAPASDVPWLATGVSVWLDYMGTAADNADRVSLDGAITYRAFSDDPVTIEFNSVELGIDGCGDVPAGMFGVRDPGGGVWKVDFGTTCTPCGTVTFEDTTVETDACLELPGLADRIITASSP